MANIQGGRLIVDGDMSGSITSDVLLIRGRKSLTLHLYSASATHVGSASIQVSIHPSIFLWNELTTKNAAAGTEMNESYTLNENDCTNFRALRVVYTAGAGVGTLQVGVS